MAKQFNNPRRSSPFSKNLVGPFSPKGSMGISWPSICEYPISSLAVLKDLPSYSNICVLAVIGFFGRTLRAA